MPTEVGRDLGRSDAGVTRSFALARAQWRSVAGFLVPMPMAFTVSFLATLPLACWCPVQYALAVQLIVAVAAYRWARAALRADAGVERKAALIWAPSVLLGMGLVTSWVAGSGSKAVLHNASGARLTKVILLTGSDCPGRRVRSLGPGESLSAGLYGCANEGSNFGLRYTLRGEVWQHDDLMYLGSGGTCEVRVEEDGWIESLASW